MKTLLGSPMAAALVAAMFQPVIAHSEVPAAAAECSVKDIPGMSCVMRGLDNPRGLAFGMDGALFVAEAGRGGAVNGPCTGVTGFNCYGQTGAVSRYRDGEQDRVATGLPSLAFVAGASARGPHDITLRSPRHRRDSVLGEGGAIITVGLEKDPVVRDRPSRADFAKLIRLPDSTLYADSADLCAHACWEPVVDIGGWQPEGNPDPNRETDPYGLLGENDGVVLVDASRNWLLRVEEDGTISRLAEFPSRFEGRSTDAVPTTVVKGPDGAYYVGELVGIPFAPGPARPLSNIYRVDAAAPHEVSILATGFNAIIDIAFHGDDLYVLQHWTLDPTGADGRLLRAKCIGRPLACGEPEVVMQGIDRATAFLIERGAMYMSIHGANPAFVKGVYTPLGEVIRIELADDDDAGEDAGT